MTTTTKTLLALCISLASAADAGASPSPRPASQRSGSENWTTVLGGAAGEHLDAHRGTALRRPAPQEESVGRSGARTFPLGASRSGRNTFSTFEHDQSYEGPNEAARKAVGGTIVEIVDFTEGHAHAGVAKVAAQQKRNEQALAGYLEGVDELKQKRDAEQEELLKKRFNNVVKIVTHEDGRKEKRYAPDFNGLEACGKYVEFKGEQIWSPEALTEEEFKQHLGEGLVVNQHARVYDYLHPVTGQKAEMAAFSADAKQVKMNKDYAEAAHEFFWRRAPAVFTYKEDAEPELDTTARKERKEAAIKQRRDKLNEYHQARRVKIIVNKKEKKVPWTQKHFDWCVRDGDQNAEDWESVEKLEPLGGKVEQRAVEREQEYKRKKLLPELINIEEQKVADGAARERLDDLTAMLAELNAAALAATQPSQASMLMLHV